MRFRAQLYLLVFVLCLFPLSLLAHEHDPPRIMPADVMQKLSAGEEIVFLDTRTDAARSASSLTLPAAIPISGVDSIKQVIQDTAKGALVVPFCT